MLRIQPPFKCVVATQLSLGATNRESVIGNRQRQSSNVTVGITSESTSEKGMYFVVDGEESSSLKTTCLSSVPPRLAISGARRIVQRQAQLPTHPRMRWDWELLANMAKRPSLSLSASASGNWYPTVH